MPMRVAPSTRTSRANSSSSPPTLATAQRRSPAPSEQEVRFVAQFLQRERNRPWALRARLLTCFAECNPAKIADVDVLLARVFEVGLAEVDLFAGVCAKYHSVHHTTILSDNLHFSIIATQVVRFYTAAAGDPVEAASPAPSDARFSVLDVLRDGVALCKTVRLPFNAINARQNAGQRYFAAKENIDRFAAWCTDEFGIAGHTIIDGGEFLEGQRDDVVAHRLGLLALKLFDHQVTTTPPPPCVVHDSKVLALKQAFPTEDPAMPLAMLKSELPAATLMHVGFRDWQMTISHPFEHPTPLAYNCCVLEGYLVAKCGSNWELVGGILARLLYQWERTTWAFKLGDGEAVQSGQHSKLQSPSAHQGGHTTTAAGAAHGDGRRQRPVLHRPAAGIALKAMETPLPQSAPADWAATAFPQVPMDEHLDAPPSPLVPPPRAPAPAAAAATAAPTTASPPMALSMSASQRPTSAQSSSARRRSTPRPVTQPHAAQASPTHPAAPGAQRTHASPPSAEETPPIPRLRSASSDVEDLNATRHLDPFSDFLLAPRNHTPPALPTAHHLAHHPTQHASAQHSDHHYQHGMRPRRSSLPVDLDSIFAESHSRLASPDLLRDDANNSAQQQPATQQVETWTRGRNGTALRTVSNTIVPAVSHDSDDDGDEDDAEDCSPQRIDARRPTDTFVSAATDVLMSFTTDGTHTTATGPVELMEFTVTRGRGSLASDSATVRVAPTDQKSVVGRGAFGSVFHGIELATLRSVAVKVVPFDSAQLTQSQLDAVHKEAELIAQVDHPNIVKCIGTAVFDDRCLCMVMEFASGGTLRRLVERFSPLRPRVAGRVVLEIANAVAYLHKQGVVHCDLKLENILLRDDGSVAIADFGCSRAVCAGENTTLVGTPHYMSPEAVEHAEPDVAMSPKRDVWAFACCLVYIFTGVQPWAHVSFESAIPLFFHIGSSGEMPFEEATFALLPAAVRECAVSCLQRDHEKRPGIEDILPLLDL